MQRELRHISRALAVRAGFLCALATAPAVAQSTTVLAAPKGDVAGQQAEAESRAAVLHALFVLRIAPYLTVETGNEVRKADEPARSGGAPDAKGAPPPTPTRTAAGSGPGDGKPPAAESKPPTEKPKPDRQEPPAPTPAPPPPGEAGKPAPGTKPPASGQPPATDQPVGDGKGDEASRADKAPGKPRAGAAKARPYRIGLVGRDDIVAVAPRHLTGKKVGEREATTVAVSLEQAIDASRAADYDLLYIAESVEAKDLQRILASHAALPKPLVAARSGFAAAGGGVQLFVQDNAVRFEINADVLRRQGVHVDSQLQKLSKRGPR